VKADARTPGCQSCHGASLAHQKNIGGSYSNSPYAVAGAPAGTVAAYYIPAQPLPTIIANSVDARLSAKYKVIKNQALHLTYEYAQLTNADYGYQGYQLGSANAILPTGQFAPYYHVQIFGLSYIATVLTRTYLKASKLP